MTLALSETLMPRQRTKIYPRSATGRSVNRLCKATCRLEDKVIPGQWVTAKYSRIYNAFCTHDDKIRIYAGGSLGKQGNSLQNKGDITQSTCDTFANAADSWWAAGVAKREKCHLSLPVFGLSPLIKLP